MMTNKEYLLSLTCEEMYEKLRWLFYEYALSFTDSRQAIIGWLDAEHHWCEVRKMRLIDADVLWMDIIHAMDYCDDILDIIESQPTVESAQQWIPCSERLPEKSDDYVLTTVIDERRIRDIYLMRCDEIESAYIKKWISAWMPLPEPYKGNEK